MIKLLLLGGALLVPAVVDAQSAGSPPALVRKMKRVTMTDATQPYVACVSPAQTIRIMESGAIYFRASTIGPRISADAKYTAGYGSARITISASELSKSRARYAELVVDGKSIKNDFVNNQLGSGRFSSIVGVDFPIKLLENLRDIKKMTIYIRNSEGLNLQVDVDMSEFPAYIWMRDNKYRC